MDLAKKDVSAEQDAPLCSLSLATDSTIDPEALLHRAMLQGLKK